MTTPQTTGFLFPDIDKAFPEMADWKRQHGKRGRHSKEELAAKETHETAQAERRRIRAFLTDLRGTFDILLDQAIERDELISGHLKQIEKLIGQLQLNNLHTQIALRALAELCYLMPDSEMNTSSEIISDHTPCIILANRYGGFSLGYNATSGFTVRVTPIPTMRRRSITINTDSTGLEPEGVLKLVALLQLQPGDKLPKRAADVVLAKPKSPGRVSALNDNLDLLSKLFGGQASQKDGALLFSFDLTSLADLLGGDEDL